MPSPRRRWHSSLTACSVRYRGYAAGPQQWLARQEETLESLSWEAPRMRRDASPQTTEGAEERSSSDESGHRAGSTRKQRTLHWQRAASCPLAVPRWEANKPDTGQAPLPTSSESHLSTSTPPTLTSSQRQAATRLSMEGRTRHRYGVGRRMLKTARRDRQQRGAYRPSLQPWRHGCRRLKPPSPLPAVGMAGNA